MLESVIRPDAAEITFKYDALGRRIEKCFRNRKTFWVWDGNVPLHEWKETASKDYSKEKGYFFNVEKTPTVTWVFEEGTFIPTARLTEGKKLSIVTNYLGTPEAMYDEAGERVWSCELNSYGRVRSFKGEGKGDCPFRYQGQYEDTETGLYYNRFRYYSPEEGMYISQDPIGLAGNNPTLYGYVKDTNGWVDAFGLDCDKVKNARERQHKMLKNNKGYNISPIDWDAYPSIGRNGTFITDKKGALDYLRNIKKGDTLTISSSKVSKIESNLGLSRGSLQNGFKVREISGISSMNPRSPLEGNEYFLGRGQHLPNGAPEMVINSISTTDNLDVTTILTVFVK